MTDATSVPRSRLWCAGKRRAVALLLVGALLFFTWPWLLRSLAAPLVAAEPVSDATGLWIVGGDEAYSEAVRFHQINPDGMIVLLKQAPGRLERLKILPPPTERAREGLLRRGIDRDRLTIVTGVEDVDAPYQAMADWLADHSDARLIVTCDAFSSRELRWTLDRDLPRESAQRLFLRPIANKTYDPSQWWISKRGVTAFVRGWLGLILPLIQPGPSMKRHECNPEQFQPAPI